MLTPEKKKKTKSKQHNKKSKWGEKKGITKPVLLPLAKRRLSLNYSLQKTFWCTSSISLQKMGGRNVTLSLLSTFWCFVLQNPSQIIPKTQFPFCSKHITALLWREEQKLVGYLPSMTLHKNR